MPVELSESAKRKQKLRPTGKGAAAAAGQSLITRTTKQELARIRTKQALGRTLTDSERALLRRANQTTDFSQ